MVEARGLEALALYAWMAAPWFAAATLVGTAVALVRGRARALPPLLLAFVATMNLATIGRGGGFGIALVSGSVSFFAFCALPGALALAAVAYAAWPARRNGGV